MPVANLGAMLADAWDEAVSLSAYGFDALTVGWHQGKAFVRMWNFRTGNNEWRRLPSRDGQQPKKAPRFDPFSSSYLYRMLK
jgi:hypothetical protein